MKAYVDTFFESWNLTKRFMFKTKEWDFFSLPADSSFFTCDIKGRYYAD